MVEVEIRVPERRVEQSMERIKTAFDCKKPDTVPVIVGQARPWPVDLKYHMDQNVKFWKHAVQAQLHFLNVDDDSYPMLVPFFGIVYLPSAFGAKFLCLEGQDPKIDESDPVLKSLEGVDDLQIPDPYTDGLMPTVLQVYEDWKKRTNVPIGMVEGFRDPLCLASGLRGNVNLFRDFYDHPDAVHKLMKKTTETVIKFTKVEKKVLGEPMDHTISAEGGVTPPKGVGIHLDACDQAGQLSPKIYKEFVLPYVEKIAETFGSAMIHGCGDHSHQWENYLNMPHAKAVHVNIMGDMSILRRLKEKIGNKKCLIAGEIEIPDFSYIDDYYKELISIGAEGGNFIINTVPYMDVVQKRTKDGKVTFVSKPELHDLRISYARKVVETVRRYGKFK